MGRRVRESVSNDQAMPNFNKTFEIECNASGIGIGTVLKHKG